jgi:hypothetical protein
MEAQKTVPVRAELFDRIEEEAQLEGKTIEEFLEVAVGRYLATARLQRLQRYGAQRARARIHRRGRSARDLRVP